MKKILSSVLLLGATTAFAFAQTGTTTVVSTSSPSNVSVSAGLTPESPFYFFDKITESLQELLAFSPDAKIKLQLAFAAERVAEAKAMLANAGDHSKGLDSIHASLVENVQKTSDILKSEKASGKDVTKLAKEANDGFVSEETDLSKSLADSHKEIVNTKIEAFKKVLEEAKAAKDEAKISDTEKAIADANQTAEDLKTKKEEIKKSFQDEKRQIEEQMSSEDQKKSEIESENEDAVEAEDSQSGETENNKESENKTGVNLEVRDGGQSTSTLRVDGEVKNLRNQEGDN